MIILDPLWRKMVEDILKRHVPEQRVVVFGSRTGGTPKPHSDLDLCIMSETTIPSKTMSALRLAFTESRLPISVDIVDWASISPDFQEVIQKHHENF